MVHSRKRLCRAKFKALDRVIFPFLQCFLANLKIESVIRNARGVLRIRETFGSLDAFLWRYVDGEPRQNAWPSMGALPARTDQSDRMSADLKQWGLNFVGSTVCYAFMQAVGMVNDHVVHCFRYNEVARLA